MGLSRLRTQLMVVLLCGMCPHAIRDLETILHVMLMPYWDLAILCHLMPFCRVEHSLLLGWSVYVMGRAMRSHAVFAGSFSQDCICARCSAIRLCMGCAVTCSHISQSDLKSIELNATFDHGHSHKK